MPAEIAREIALQTGAEFRIGLGCDRSRLGDGSSLRLLLCALAQTGGDVRLIARQGQPLVVELRGAAAAPPTGVLAEQSGAVTRYSILAPELPDAPPELERANSGEHLRGRRVLVADDSATNRMVLREMLAGAGADVTSVEDGVRAVDAAAGRTFDILMLDIAMPQMDGITALHMIRRTGNATPAIAVTANAMDHQVTEYLAQGFDAHIAKPLRYDDLIRRILELS